ncbi:MAG: ShlB/FhaC/HecB family hemolysin secretion/activation protein [Betaproteobacteria bacterium]|nr:ShlB/FhaC/HecB family hemolysin secretion/activation protein [Betaproteobacteria bacterium]
MNVWAAKAERFNVTQVLVEGNTLLPDAQLAELMAPLVGKRRVVDDVARTRLSLKNAYRRAGFPDVEVNVPEQKLLGGIIKLRVVERIRVVAMENKDAAPDMPFVTAEAKPALSSPVESVSPSPPEAQHVEAISAAGAAPATEEIRDERFSIKQFLIEGNTLLPPEKLAGLAAPFVGEKKVYGDVQRALEAVEGAYRAEGYNTVQVYVPEQELTHGAVKLQVSEGVIDKVTVTGNKYFSTKNVRDGLPALKEGVAPNARQLSKNIQLSNDNAAKQVEVILGMSEEEGKIDAKVAVTEENPLKYSLTIDNTGSGATGKHRTGLAYQHANLFDLDHTLTLAYTTSPDAPKGVTVNILSFAYRLPLYGLGDSLDMVYGKSSVNTPSVQSTGFGLTGKGDVFALRFNHYFARRGEYSAKIAFGFDYKYFNTRCSINGVAQSFEPPVPAIASCTPHTARPISVTYSGQKQGAAAMLDYNIGLSYNLPLGNKYLSNGSFDYYSFIAGRPVEDHFSVLRFGASYLTVMFTDWQVKAAISAQYTNTGLIAGEQFGLAGSNAVRGFTERAAAADRGEMLNFEAYSPELAKQLNIPGSLRGVLFYDISHGRNIGVVAPTPATAGSLAMAAAGFGLRYSLQKDLNIRADVAQVAKAGPPGTEAQGEWRGHFSMLFSF